MPRVRVFHCDAYAVPLPPGHRFPMPKYRLLRERLLADGTLRAEDLTASRPIDLEALLLAHDRRYVESVVAGGLTSAEVRRLGFPWSEELVLRSRSSVQGTVLAAREALCNGVAGNLAGGTHHAFADHGEGYCVFNDHAVAARLLQLEGRIDRAVIVDLDVHQGNGTAAIFARDPSVFTFSMHGARNFPFHKQRSSLDVELPDGCEDAEYLALLERHLPDVLDAARADVLFYQGGVDPLAEDALGRLRLTHQGLRARDGLVLAAARDRGIPVVLTLGGGYARPLEASVEAHCGTYREAAAIFARAPA
jgi:acetoin utilization deacetylase AcuC-like enzyme